MVTDYTPPPWDEALYSFIQHLKGTSRAKKTVEFYQYLLNIAVHYAEDTNIPLDKFGKRSLDEYLVWRQETGHTVSGKQLSLTTLHSSARVVKVFMKYCSRYDLIPRNLLADYELRKVANPHKYMPIDNDMISLLEAIHNFWNPLKNKSIKAFSAARRGYHRDRNYALVLTLLDSACRIGEALSLKTSDLQQTTVKVKDRDKVIWQITVRESGSSETTKGRSSRYVPLSDECVEAIQAWLKIRARTMKEAPKDSDEGWLFISETGGRCDESRFLKSIRRITNWAELPSAITLHSLRRFSINKLSKIDVLGAQRIAGHKDTKTTLIYTELDAGHVAAVHERAGVVKGIVAGRKTVRKRLVG